MTHWSDAYLGRPYLRDSYNCADMAIEVQQREFGRALDVIGAHPAGGLAQAEAVEAAIGERLRRVDSPVDGDVVLLRSKGQLRHLGVYCAIGGGMVLHACRRAGVVRTALRDLPAIRMEVAGFYRPC